MFDVRYSEKAPLPFIRREIFNLALSAVLITLALMPLVVAKGVPAFEQDWQWPVHPAQCASYAHLGAQPWNSAGVGGAQSYPEPWLPYLAAGSLCSAVGPHVSLWLYLAFLLALAAIGIAWLAKTWNLTGLGTLCAIACYLGNPVLLNKLHAGHLHFIFSYAVLPFFLATILDERTRNHPLIMGALLGLASAQQQFFFFGIFLGVLIGLRNGATWFLRAGPPAFLIALCFTMPQWILAATHPASAASFGAYRPLLHWEESQSVPLLQAARFLGYIGGYDTALSGWIQALLWTFPLLALGGAVLAIARRSGRVWTAAAVCGLLLVAGLRGPITPLLGYATQHSNALAAIRELYNVEAIVVLAYAMMIAAVVGALAASRSFRPAAFAAAAFVIFTAGSVSVYEGRGLPTFSLSERGDAAIGQIAAVPGFDRYLPVPSGLPQSPAGSKVAGLSPFTLPIAGHASALDPLYETPYSTIAAAENALPAGLLTALGVSHVLRVPGVAQTSDYEPQLRTVFPPRSSGVQTAWDVEKIPAERIALLPAATVELMNRAPAIDLNAQAQDVNPRNGWARTTLWNNLPAWMYDRPAGIFTLMSSARVELPAPSSMLAGSASGNLQARGCRRTQKLDSHYSVYHCAGSTTLSGAAPIAISEAIAGGDIRFVRISTTSPGFSTVINDRRWIAAVDARAFPQSVLVLRERFDSGWDCIGCNGVHARADGYANAWILPRGVNGRLSIVFLPARQYYAALGISIATLLAAAIFSMWFFGTRRTTFRQRGKHEATDPLPSP